MTQPSEIAYRRNVPLGLEAFTDLYRQSTLAQRRPAEHPDVMAAMKDNANETITAWDGEQLVGLARTLTDYEYVAYLADLAVARSHQGRGVGRELVRETRELLGERCMVVLFAAPAADAYYERIGFERNTRGWVLRAGQPLK